MTSDVAMVRCGCCLQELIKLKFDLGIMKGGSQGCAHTAYGDIWTNAQEVRFQDDEPVRHKLLDLLVSLVHMYHLPILCMLSHFANRLHDPSANTTRTHRKLHFASC